MRIGLVPLDDRPCTAEFPKRLAEIFGVELITPPRDMIGHFLSPGHPHKIEGWLENVAESIDWLVVAADMVSYGGLIASRCPDREESECIRSIGVLERIKRRRPDLPIFVSSVLMRTSITVRDEKTALYWDLINQISVLQGRIEEGTVDSEGAERLSSLMTMVPNELLETYWAARKRNFRVAQELLRLVRDGTVDYLVLSQEDANRYGPHRREQRELEKIIDRHGIGERVAIYPGADEVTQVLLCRAVLAARGIAPSVFCRYFPYGAEQNIAPFEDRPVAETVAAQTRAAGLKMAPGPEEADLLVVVNCPRVSAADQDGWEDRLLEDVHLDAVWNDSLAELISWMSAVSRVRPVGVLDVAVPNGADSEFLTAVLDNVGIGGLSAYAGWNTAGNSIGTGISHLVAGYVAHLDGRSAKEALAFLLERLADDYVYQRLVRPELAKLIGAHPEWGNRHRLTEPGWAAVNEKLSELMIPLVCDVADRYLVKTCGGWQLSRVSVELPWERIFEVRVKVEIESGSAARCQEA